MDLAELPGMTLRVWLSIALAASVATSGKAHADADAGTTTPSKPIEYGIGLRARQLHVDERLLELFMERVPGPAKGYGVGIELARRRGDLELQLSGEVDYLEPAEGVYIDKGADVADPPTGGGDEADFVLAPEHNGNKRLAWMSLEFTFLNHASITKRIKIRYGAGLGVGVIRGKLGRYDIICSGATNANPEPGCVPPDPTFNGSGTYSDDGGRITPGTIATYDLPRVLPVVNAIIGVQIRPFEKMTINIETGIRTVPFVGVSTAFFF